MFVNLDTIPAGQAMYTLAITDEGPDTAPDDVHYDEVDFVASTHITAREVVRRAAQAGALEGYEGQRVIGVINQSDSYVMIEDSTTNLWEA